MPQQPAQQPAAQHQQQQQNPPTREVIVKDVDISFMQMVNLLIKLAIASIPAAILLSLFFGAMTLLLGVFFGGMGALMG